MKLSAMDVIFCTTVVTGIISNLKPSLLFFVIFFANVSNFMYDVITIRKLENRVGGLLKWRYTMTCMYYSSTNLCGVTPNHTLYNEIKIYPKCQRKIDDISIFFRIEKMMTSSKNPQLWKKMK